MIESYWRVRNMSEELRRGIPKAIKTGKTREYTDAEKTILCLKIY